MNDGMPVRVTHRRTNFAKQFQPFRYGNAMRLAILVERNAVHVFHHEVG